MFYAPKLFLLAVCLGSNILELEQGYVIAALSRIWVQVLESNFDSFGGPNLKSLK